MGYLGDKRSSNTRDSGRLWLVLLLLVLGTIPVALCQAIQTKDVFAKGNLLAWNFIAFDSAHRTPLEQVQMLKRLGIQRMGIEWSRSGIQSFDQEIVAMRENHIAIQGFWVRGNMYPERNKPTAVDGDVALVLATLKRNQLSTQIWDPFDADDEFMALSEPERLKRATDAVRYVARRAAQIHCSVAIYSHGGWMGEPENELEVVKQVGMPNVGIVYDYEHARPQMNRFPEFFPKLVPHLWAVILNGMQDGGPPVITVGDGDRDLELTRVICGSGYRGPIGLINHDDNRDAEVGLRMNMEGLKKLLKQLDARAALQTY
jgi:hypothetical protein